MKAALLLCVVVLVSVGCCVLGSPLRRARAAPSTVRADKVAYFTQKVDHFNPEDQRTWKQKYLIYDDNYNPGGPIFLFLGGEAPIEFFDFQEVLPRTLTKQFGALYIALEHRFYGASMPLPDFSTESLRYLTSRQALEDASNFLVSFNKTTGENQPWIVWGCSYSGALSAWFRTKYPNLVIGSVAPSGPVFALTNYTQYYGQFSESATPECAATVKKASSVLSSHLLSLSGRQTLQETFNACDVIPESPEDHYYFLLSLVEAIGGSDQFQNPPDWPLNTTCNTIMSSGDYLKNWATLFNTQQDALGKRAACNDFNETSSYIIPLQAANNADRSWLFQQCTEFGFFMPTYGSVFPLLGLEHQVRWCEKIFGIPNLQPDTEAVNAYYGGFDLQGTNILFTNGIYDPWHRLSINKDLPGGGVKAVTYAAGHCAPMTAPTNEDPVSLQQARVTVANFIAGLLSSTSSSH